MDTSLQIGKVKFHITGCAEYCWRAADRGFMMPDSSAETEADVEVCDERAIPIPADAPSTVTYDETAVWEKPDEEYRVYRAGFLPGSPVYAASRRNGNRLQIGFDFSTGAWQSPNMHLWNLLHLENYLLENDALVLHCCYLMYRGQAILFTAPSGTGKTTQANLWKKLYGAEIINGDKCLLQRNNGRWEAWGFPLHGSAAECRNLRYPIRAIAVVRQAPEDRVIPLNPMQRVGLLYSETTVNSWHEGRVQRALDLLEDLAGKVEVVRLNCTMNDSAAEALRGWLEHDG